MELNLALGEEYIDHHESQAAHEQNRTQGHVRDEFSMKIEKWPIIVSEARPPFILHQLRRSDLLPLAALFLWQRLQIHCKAIDAQILCWDGIQPEGRVLLKRRRDALATVSNDGGEFSPRG